MRVRDFPNNDAFLGLAFLRQHAPDAVEVVLETDELARNSYYPEVFWECVRVFVADNTAPWIHTPETLWRPGTYWICLPGSAWPVRAIVKVESSVEYDGKVLFYSEQREVIHPHPVAVAVWAALIENSLTDGVREVERRGEW